MPAASDLPDSIRSEMPDLDVRRRISRDSGSSESPMLSLAGGLLLGLLVGIVVAVLLIARNEEEGASSERQTGITLLTDHGPDDQSSSSESTAVTG
ncbi:MAG: hypothetical protein R3A46_13195 [Thermomicrobiales bacterium]